MKRILYVIFALAAMSVAATTLSAQNNGGHQMSSSPKDGTYKFTIEGTVDLNVPDSCYNIYITDFDGKISDNDLVASVKVKDKKFRYETNIDVIKQGRIRAVMRGKELSSAWINLYFIPGFTVYMTIHNGYFDIHNEDQYKFMVAAWQNEVPLSALMARLGVNSFSSDKGNNSASNHLEESLQFYRSQIEEIKQQIDYVSKILISGDEKAQQIKKLLDRIEAINKKMDTLVDSYAAGTL